MFCCNSTAIQNWWVKENNCQKKILLSVFSSKFSAGAIIQDFLSSHLNLEQCHTARAGSQLLSCKASNKTWGEIKGYWTQVAAEDYGQVLERVCVPQEENACTQVCSLCLCRAWARVGYLSAGLEWVTAGTQPCHAVPGGCWLLLWDGSLLLHILEKLESGENWHLRSGVQVWFKANRSCFSFLSPKLSQDESSAFRQHPPTKKVGLSCVHLHSVALSVSKLSVPVWFPLAT